MKVQSCIIQNSRESIDTIDIDKEISQTLKDVLCGNETKTLVDTEKILENSLNKNYRTRNGKVVYKD